MSPPPPSEHPKREPSEAHRIEKDTTGLVVDRVVLTNCYFRCTHCNGIFSADMVGLRYVSDTREIRNQPRCTSCRKYTP